MRKSTLVLASGVVLLATCNAFLFIQLRAERAQRAELRGQVAALPAQPRHRRGEVHRVLAGAAADLQHLARVREVLAQHRQDRLAVALAGGGMGSGGHRGRRGAGPRRL